MVRMWRPMAEKEGERALEILSEMLRVEEWIKLSPKMRWADWSRRARRAIGTGTGTGTETEVAGERMIIGNDDRAEKGDTDTTREVLKDEDIGQEVARDIEVTTGEIEKFEVLGVVAVLREGSASIKAEAQWEGLRITIIGETDLEEADLLHHETTGDEDIREVESGHRPHLLSCL